MGESRHPAIPAIVLGRGPTALGILRCLRMAGIPAYVACPPGDLTARSRWYRPTPGDATWDGTLGAIGVDALRRLPLPRAVLIPGADDTALWVAGLETELAERFPSSNASHEALTVLQDKSRFATFLQGTGIAHPRTFMLESAADIDTMPFEALDRVFIKPVNSQTFSDVVGVKGVWVRRREELHAAWAPLHAQGFRLMAQEYVPGTAADHYFVDGFRDRDGHLKGLFARRRLRISPPDFGNSSYCRSIPLSEVQAAVTATRLLLEKLGYRGIFSAEFKRDARDGQYRILEVNTRAWTYVEFAARCRVNVCAMAYADALGLAVPEASVDYAVGSGCVDLYHDLPTVWTQRARVPGLLPRALWQWLGAHYHVFRFDDPRPGLDAARRVLAKRLRLRQQR